MAIGNITTCKYHVCTFEGLLEWGGLFFQHTRGGCNVQGCLAGRISSITQRIQNSSKSFVPVIFVLAKTMTRLLPTKPRGVLRNL